MRTCKNNTFSVLNSYFLNTQIMRINEGWLNDHISTPINTNKEFYDMMKNKRKKSHSIAWDAFMYCVNCLLKYNDYNTVCTSAQLKEWLNTYGNGYDSIKETVDFVEWKRGEIA